MTAHDLFVAIETVDLTRVQTILRDNIAIVNCSDEENYRSIKPIHRAVGVAGDFPDASAIVSELISAGADVNALGVNGETPLHIAVRQDQVSEVIQLIKVGAKLDIRDWHHQTPFESIARSQKYSCIGVLLAHGAGDNIRDSVAFNRIDWVRWILHDDPDAIQKEPRSVDLVFYAIESGNLEMLQLLISKGAEVNSSLGSTTPLERAIGWTEIVRKLLEAGADPNGCRPPVPLPDWRYPAWESPLAIAKRRGFTEDEALLKQYGATE